MTMQDVPAVAAIERQCFSLPWSEQSLIDSITREDTLFLVCTEAVESADDVSYTKEAKQTVLGYIGMYLSFDEGDITNVAVAPEHRQRGVGQFLVAHAKVAAKEKRIENILLEVRVSNAPAISLYKKMGFEELGLRKNFYEHPVEDAIIMKCPLGTM